jgi:hypothetical protein
MVAFLVSCLLLFLSSIAGQMPRDCCGLDRLIEVVRDSGGMLSVLLAEHHQQLDSRVSYNRVHAGIRMRIAGS